MEGGGQRLHYLPHDSDHTRLHPPPPPPSPLPPLIQTFSTTSMFLIHSFPRLRDVNYASSSSSSSSFSIHSCSVSSSLHVLSAPSTLLIIRTAHTRTRAHAHTHTHTRSYFFFSSPSSRVFLPSDVFIAFLSYFHFTQILGVQYVFLPLVLSKLFSLPSLRNHYAKQGQHKVCKSTYVKVELYVKDKRGSVRERDGLRVI